MTMRSGAATGSGWSTTACTALKIAVVAPMPSASVTIATRLNAGRGEQLSDGEGGVLPQLRKILKDPHALLPLMADGAAFTAARV